MCENIFLFLDKFHLASGLIQLTHLHSFSRSFSPPPTHLAAFGCNKNHFSFHIHAFIFNLYHVIYRSQNCISRKNWHTIRNTRIKSPHHCDCCCCFFPIFALFLAFICWISLNFVAFFAMLYWRFWNAWFFSRIVITRSLCHCGFQILTLGYLCSYDSICFRFFTLTHNHTNLHNSFHSFFPLHPFGGNLCESHFYRWTPGGNAARLCE